jgi:hypothetical protein
VSISDRIDALPQFSRQRLAFICLGEVESRALLNPKGGDALMLERAISGILAESISPSTASVTAPADDNGNGRGAGVQFAGVLGLGSNQQPKQGLRSTVIP